MLTKVVSFDIYCEKVLAKSAHRAREIIAFSIDSLLHSRFISPNYAT